MEYSFISGATGGIGKAFSITLAKDGFNLFLTGRSDDKLNLLKSEILSVNPNISVLTCVCDLTDKAGREKLLDFATQNDAVFNRIVHVAGVDTQKAFLSYTREKVLFQLSVNAEATTDLTYLLLKRRAPSVEILVVGSMSGQTPMPYFAIYSATKAYLLNLFTALHYELKDDGVKVTTVLPGGVFTRPDIVEEIKSQGLWGRLTAKTPEYIAKKSLKAVKKNKVKYIPGFFNKLLNLIISIAPKRIVLTFIKRRWKKHSKDAF